MRRSYVLSASRVLRRLSRHRSSSLRCGRSTLTAGHRCPTCTTILGAIHVASMAGETSHGGHCQHNYHAQRLNRWAAAGSRSILLLCRSQGRVGDVWNRLRRCGVSEARRSHARPTPDRGSWCPGRGLFVAAGGRTRRPGQGRRQSAAAHTASARRRTRGKAHRRVGARLGRRARPAPAVQRHRGVRSAAERLKRPPDDRVRDPGRAPTRTLRRTSGRARGRDRRRPDRAARLQRRALPAGERPVRRASPCRGRRSGGAAGQAVPGVAGDGRGVGAAGHARGRGLARALEDGSQPDHPRSRRAGWHADLRHPVKRDRGRRPNSMAARYRLRRQLDPSSHPARPSPRA
jgi:hypothetical protein